MRVSILAIGKNRQGVFKDLYQFYAKNSMGNPINRSRSSKNTDWKNSALTKLESFYRLYPKTHLWSY